MSCADIRTQHVRMNRWQAGTLRRGRDQVIDGLTSERLAALRDEEPGEAVPTGCQIPLDRAEFVARDRLFDSLPVLEAPNPEAGLIEVDALRRAIAVVLAYPDWRQKLEPRDVSALTPLIWEHVNPYGRLELDMNARIPLD